MQAETINTLGNIVKLFNVTDVDILRKELKALWEPAIYKVTLNRNDGTGETSEIYAKYKTGMYSNESGENCIIKITPPTRSGYVFAGYYDGDTQVIDADGNIKLSGQDITYTAEKELKAKWTDVYTITLNSNSAQNSGTGSIYFKKDDDSYYSDLDCTTKITRIVCPIYSGYTFGGYKNGDTQIIDESGNIVGGNNAFSASTTLDATKTVEKYTLQFIKNEGYAFSGRVTGTANNTTVTFGETVQLPTLSCDYCTFNG